jgi:hypothetical protein
MPVRCPACKADNAQGPTCRRCKADLGLLFALEERRAWLLARARRYLADGLGTEAVQFAGEAEGLRGGTDARQVLAAAHLLDRDFGRAWACYRTVPGEVAATP